jgi:hypothetical protein
MGQNQQTKNFYTDEFLLSFINYVLSVYANMKGAQTIPQLVQAYAISEHYKLDYVRLNANATRKSMAVSLESRIIEITNSVRNSINI